MNTLSQFSVFSGKWLIGFFASFFLAVGFYIPEAEAKRFGGGSSFGRVAPTYKAPSKPVSPTKDSTATSGTKPAGSTTGAAAQPRRSFMGPLGGLAAGLGLAALFSYMGFGEEMASVLGTMLMLGLGFIVIRWLLRTISSQGSNRPAYQGASAHQEHVTTTYKQPYQAPVTPLPSAESVSSVSPAVEEVSGGYVAKQLPVGFEEEKFVQSAKSFFTMIQRHFDAGNLEALGEYCTPEVLEYAKAELGDRGAADNVTSVVTLEAELIGFETDVDEEIATVAFDALMREERDGIARPVHELWVLTRPTDGSRGWVLAGVQSV